jgi:hypothetical protein
VLLPGLMWRPLAGALLGFPAAFGSMQAIAGSASGAIPVAITLSMPGYVGPPPMVSPTGTCVSETLSEETGAVVRVTCPGGVFVSIGPRPGGRFVGSHGGAYSYYFGGFGGMNRAGYGELAQGSGTIASFRVYSVAGESDGPIDMLVSF